MNRHKVDSQLHTVASEELQKEINAILAKEKEKDEDTVKHDGGRSDSDNTEGK